MQRSSRPNNDGVIIFRTRLRRTFEFEKIFGKNMSKPPAFKKNRINRKRAKTKIRSKKQDPLSVNGERPRPMFVDYKDLELLKKLTSRQGKIISRRKTGCSAVSQHAVATAIKRARFMALMPYVGD